MALRWLRKLDAEALQGGRDRDARAHSVLKVAELLQGACSSW